VELRPLQVSVVELGSGEIDVVELRMPEVSTVELRILEISIVELGRSEICFIEMGLSECHPLTRHPSKFTPNKIHSIVEFHTVENGSVKDLPNLTPCTL
jgi:hypothetical protein